MADDQEVTESGSRQELVCTDLWCGLNDQCTTCGKLLRVAWDDLEKLLNRRQWGGLMATEEAAEARPEVWPE